MQQTAFPRREAGNEQSERSLMAQRSKGRSVGSADARAERVASASEQGGPATGGGGQGERVPSPGAVESSSGDDTQHGNVIPISPEPELSHYKGISLVSIGRDPRTGKVIPHQRSEKLARQIAEWVAGGFNENDIAVRTNIRPGLIKKHYHVELQTGRTNVHMDVHGHILRRVKKSDRMAIFYAKSQMGYKEGENAQQQQQILSIHLHE